MFNNKLLTRKFWFWFGWVVVNALGGAIGVMICERIGIINLEKTSAITVFALTVAISVSACQAIFIQKEYIPKQRMLVVSFWLFLSSCCSTFMISTAPSVFIVIILITIPISILFGQVSQYLFFGLTFILFGFISGVITGFAQHFLLPVAAGKLKRRWILYSGVGCALGLGIAAIIVSIFFKEPIFRLSGSFNPVQSLGMYGMTVFSTIGGIINGAITGVEIVRLFGERQAKFSSLYKE